MEEGTPHSSGKGAPKGVAHLVRSQRELMRGTDAVGNIHAS